MKSVLKLICLFGLAVLVIVTAFAFSSLFQLPQPGELSPILSSVGIVLLAECALFVVYAVFTKRHTTASGFG